MQIDSFKRKVFVITLWPINSTPSSRFRIGQYCFLFEQPDFDVNNYSFFNGKELEIIKSKGRALNKIYTVIKCYLRCLCVFYRVLKVDFVFVHREFTPFGPPFVIWFISKILRKRIIFDFDDAIWLTDSRENKWLRRFIRNPYKIETIIACSWKISCGNQYLLDFAKQYNPNVVLNPTTIDTENLHNKLKDQDTPSFNIGWTGSSTTLKYLDDVVPMLKELEKEIDFTFILICNKKPTWSLKSLIYIEWNAETEIEDLLKINIGIMPLPDDDWARGKCGFKALQYMALGMPALVSPVGVNKKIVDHGLNGFYCNTNEEWIAYIKHLSTNLEERKNMGQAARQKILEKFSILSNMLTFYNLFKL